MSDPTNTLATIRFYINQTIQELYKHRNVGKKSPVEEFGHLVNHIF